MNGYGEIHIQLVLSIGDSLIGKSNFSFRFIIDRLSALIFRFFLLRFICSWLYWVALIKYWFSWSNFVATWLIITWDWFSDHIITYLYNRFYVDDIPIRRYENKVDGTFPDREMWMYGSIWDASDWATDNGKYRADYQYQPFVAHFTNFKIGGCTTDSPANCHPVPASGTGSALSDQQYQAMLWAQKNSMTYYYCQDYSKDRSLYPEC